MKTPLPLAALSLLLGLWAPPTQAGRPLSTDDASTADAHSCQLESWYERAGSELALTLAPACGLTDSLELDLGAALPAQRQTTQAEAGLALKWVPRTFAVDTPLGRWTLGLKAGVDLHQEAGWRREALNLLALSSLQWNDAWAWHANLGQQRGSGVRASVLNLAAVWTPTERHLLFAELSANDRPAWLGGTTRAIGSRWWLDKDRLGLDATVSRDTGAAATTHWTLGFGWYGLGF